MCTPENTPCPDGRPADSATAGPADPSIRDDTEGILRFEHCCNTGPGASPMDEDSRLLQRWVTKAYWAPFLSDWTDTGPERHVASLSWVLVDRLEGMDEAWEEMDRISAELEAYGSVLLQMVQSGEIDRESSAALVLLYARSADPDRGTGIGRLLAWEVVRFAALGRIGLPVLCLPEPDDNLAPAERQSALTRLRDAARSLHLHPTKADPDFFTGAADVVIDSVLTGVLAPALREHQQNYR